MYRCLWASRISLVTLHTSFNSEQPWTNTSRCYSFSLELEISYFVQATYVFVFLKKKILFKSYNREKVKLEGHLAWEHLGKLSFVREIKSIKWFGLRINVKPLSVQVMKPKLVARVLWHFQISVFNTSTEKRQPFQCWKWPLSSKPIRKDYNIVGAEPITGIRFIVMNIITRDS